MDIISKDEKEFIYNSIKLYEQYNSHHLFYKGENRYNKLVTADPFYVTLGEYKEFIKRGPHIWQWIEEQTEFYKEIFSQKSLSWLRETFEQNHSKETLDYQKEITNRSKRRTKIIRVDLSSLPYKSHEAQLRWGAIGHIHFLPEIMRNVIPQTDDGLLMASSLKEEFMEVINKACGSNEYAVYLTPSKFQHETEYFAQDIEKVMVMLVSDFNEQNFIISKDKLIHKATNREIRLVIRRELTLESLSRTDFGRKVIELYIGESLDFEPDLNMINDSKLGLAFAYDERTKSFFSDESRELFLKTSLLDEKMESFNNVFDRNYTSIDNFINTTSQKERSYVYKFGGFDLNMSFGSSHVYRLDRTKNKSLELIKQTYNKSAGEWILQEFDHTRYKVRYLVGDYNNLSTCRIAESESCSARFMLFYSKPNGKIRLLPGLANFVNDYWKSRFKDSDQQSGIGSIITPLVVDINS